MALHDDYLHFWGVALQGYREVYGLELLPADTKAFRTDEKYIGLEFPSVDNEGRRVRGMMADLRHSMQQDNRKKLVDAAQDRASANGKPKMPRAAERYEGELEFINAAVADLAAPGAAVFYFDDMDMKGDSAEALLETASEFYRAGILRAPYDRVLYICRYKGLTIPVYARAREGGDGYIITCFLRDHPLLKGNKAAVLPAAVVEYPIGAAGSIKDGEILRGQTDAAALFAPKDVSPDDLKIYVAESILYFLMGSMVLSLPHYERMECSIEPKLAKARAKAGKKPLQTYTVIRPIKAIRDSMQDGNGGWKVRPHWRRGHIRRLANGKAVPIPPCMVNWAGDTELAKNIYQVSGDADAKGQEERSNAGVQDSKAGEPLLSDAASVSESENIVIAPPDHSSAG